MIIKLIEAVYGFLWGDLITIPLPGGGGLGLSLLVLLLIPTGIYFTLRTRFLPIRMFPDMIHAMTEKKERDGSAISTFQALVVSTATRVGMGNLVGVVAAISAGGAGAVFWMWLTAIIGSSTAFIEATEDIGAALLTTSTITLRESGAALPAVTVYWLYCLPCLASSAGAVSAR